MEFRKGIILMISMPCTPECRVLLKKIKNGIFTYSFSCGKNDAYLIEAYLPRCIGAKCVYLEKDGNKYEFAWTSIKNGYDVFVLDLHHIFNNYGYHILFNIKFVNDSGIFSIEALNSLVLNEMSSHTFKPSQIFTQPFIFTFKEPSSSFDIKGSIYHIFVDRFNKKDPVIRSDSKYNPDWEKGIPEFAEKNGDFLENNMHFGGNFKGISEKIDYLKSLSVDCIYLSPVSKAYSNHKYDVGSYFEIDENFGGEEDLKKLIALCHENGIKVIFDSVFNHTGDNSLYFNRFGSYNSIGAYQSEKSNYYSWYTFTNYPDEYLSWWGIKCLPSIKKGSKEFMDYVCGKGGVIDYYMSLGADGLRLDVADELTLEFIERIKKAVKRNKENGIVIGEVWENATRKEAYGENKYYFDENKLDSVTNYPLMNGIIEYIKTGNSSKLHSIISELYNDYPEDNLLKLMNIISTHDTVRAISRFSSPPNTNREKSVFKMSKEDYQYSIKRIKNAVALQAFLPGIPCIYYGDEIGMEGLEDPFNRFPMTWHRISNELLEWYKEIMGIRKNNRPLSMGGIRIIYSNNGFFVFDRFYANEKVRIFINQGENPHNINLDGTDVFENRRVNQITVEPLGCKAIRF